MDEYAPIFSNDHTKLYCGSSLNKDLLASDTLDLIITSPPYNVGIDYTSNSDLNDHQSYLKWCKKWLESCYFCAKSGARFCPNIPLDKNKGGQQSVGADMTQLAKEVGWKYHSTIIWNEGNISRRTAWGSWLSASAPYVIAPVELILVLYKDEWRRKDKGISTISKEEFMAWTSGVWRQNADR